MCDRRPHFYYYLIVMTTDLCFVAYCFTVSGAKEAKLSYFKYSNYSNLWDPFDLSCFLFTHLLICGKDVKGQTIKAYDVRSGQSRNPNKTGNGTKVTEAGDNCYYIKN